MQTSIRRMLNPFCLLLCWLAMAFALAAQTGWRVGQVIPDSMSLMDSSLYLEPAKAHFLMEGGRQLMEADPVRGLERYVSIYEEARQQHQHETQAIAAISIAMRLNELGRVEEAVGWSARALALDSLFSPMAPSRQFLHNSLASFYGGLGAARMALPHSRMSVDICLRRDKTKGARLFRNMSSLAINYQQAGMMDSALACYAQANEVAKENGDPYWIASGLNNYGLALLQTGDAERALAQLTAALAHFRRSASPDTSFLGAIMDNQGMALMALGRTQEALASFNDNWRRFSATPDTLRRINAGLQCVKAHLALRQLPQAEVRLSQVLDFLGRCRQHQRERTRLATLQAQLSVAEAAGSLKEQVRLQHDLLAYTDSLAQLNGKSKILAMESLIQGKGEEFRQELDVERLRAAESAATARYRGVLAVAIGLGCVLLLAVLIPLQRRRISRMRALAERQRLRRAHAQLRLQQEQMEKERMSHELELKQKDITDLAMDITLKRRLTTELVERLRQVKASQHPVREIQEMILSLKSQTENEVQTRLTPENIDLVNHAFYEKLKATYPGLTAAEMDLCGLLRMRLGSKEIAALRNITAHSVRVSKYRLKKKLNLGKDEDLMDVLQKL